MSMRALHLVAVLSSLVAPVWGQNKPSLGVRNMQIQAEAKRRVEAGQIDRGIELRLLSDACTTFREYGVVFDPRKLTQHADPHYGYADWWGYEFMGLEVGAKDLGLRATYFKSLGQRDIDRVLAAPEFQSGKAVLYLRTIRLLGPAQSGGPYDPYLGGLFKRMDHIRYPGTSRKWFAETMKGVVRVLGRGIATYSLKDLSNGKVFEVRYNQLKGLTCNFDQYQTEGILFEPPLKPLPLPGAQHKALPPGGDETIPPPPGEGGTGTSKES
jgi:hypothetical protein